MSHAYSARLTWEGNSGSGTSTYDGYGRQYSVAISGKTTLSGSSDPAFRGDPALHNPEDLFLAAISACHMLTYLALCARKRINVLAYEDDATGMMSVDASGGGRFERVVLHPRVTIAAGGNLDLAIRLHHKARELCFIANSCSVPIDHDPVVEESE